LVYNVLELLYFYASLASMCTGAYTMRLLYFVFGGFPRVARRRFKTFRESKAFYFTIPLSILSFFSIFGGYFASENFWRISVHIFLGTKYYFFPIL